MSCTIHPHFDSIPQIFTAPTFELTSVNVVGCFAQTPTKHTKKTLLIFKRISWKVTFCKGSSLWKIPRENPMNCNCIKHSMPRCSLASLGIRLHWGGTVQQPPVWRRFSQPFFGWKQIEKMKTCQEFQESISETINLTFPVFPQMFQEKKTWEH